MTRPVNAGDPLPLPLPPRIFRSLPTRSTSGGPPGPESLCLHPHMPMFALGRSRVHARAQVVKVESARSADQTGDSWFFMMTSSCFSCSSRCRSRVGVGRARPRHARQNNTCMFAMYTHTTQDKDPYNMLPERVMTAHGIIRRCPTTTPHFVGNIHRQARTNAGFGENYGNAGEIGRMFPWFGWEDRAPRESSGFVAMYVRWWVRGNYWLVLRGGCEVLAYRSVRGAGAKHISTTSERRR